MATLQTPGIPQGDQTGWDIELKADLVALNNDIAALQAAISGLSTPGTVSPFGALANVKDYGAVGNGSTDDTAAIIRARDAVFASLNPNGQCTKALYFPSGKYRVTQPGTLMNTPNVSGGAQTQIRSFYILGDGKRKSQIFYDYSGLAAAGRHPADNALFIAGNRTSQLRVKDIGFLSNVGTNNCFFFWSRTGTGSGTGGAYPEYGTGNNQDTLFEDVEFSGSWQWCFLLDGDITSNLNSEFFCRNLATTPLSTFGGAFFQVGYTAFTTNDQQDQFVNYSFENCKIEYKNGDAFVFNRGGVVHFTGGSFINGVSDTANVGGAFFKASDVSFHNSGATFAQFHSVRFELRTTNCRIFDVQGWYGEGAHISMYDCNDSGHAFTSDGPLTKSAIFRTHSGQFPNVRLQNCYFGGYWQLLGTQTGTGRFVFDQCGFYNWKGGIGTVTAANTFLRYDTATIPKYRYRDCASVTDASN